MKPKPLADKIKELRWWERIAILIGIAGTASAIASAPLGIAYELVIMQFCTGVFTSTMGPACVASEFIIQWAPIVIPVGAIAEISIISRQSSRKRRTLTIIGTMATLAGFAIWISGNTWMAQWSAKEYMSGAIALIGYAIAIASVESSS